MMPNLISEIMANRRRLDPKKKYNLLVEREHKTIPRYLLERLHSGFSRSYVDGRGLREYNDYFKAVGINGLLYYIKQNPRRKVRVFDPGAGKGNLRKDLENIFPNTREGTKLVEYTGTDILPRTEKDKLFVKKHILGVDKIPENYYDCIPLVQVMQYVPNNIGVFGELVDSLRVGGFLLVDNLGNMSIKNDANGVAIKKRFNYDFAKLFKHVIEQSNPHLEVVVKNGLHKAPNPSLVGVVVLKKEEGKFVNPFTYQGFEFLEQGLSKDFAQGKKVSVKSKLVSSYTL